MTPTMPPRLRASFRDCRTGLAKPPAFGNGFARIVPMLRPSGDSAASAQEHGRIKRKPPTAIEAERIASDMAMNDSLLRKGDIVVTDRGFFVFRGTAEDGIANDFAPVPNPLSSAKK
jgi:hypothetical protein